MFETKSEAVLFVAALFTLTVGVILLGGCAHPAQSAQPIVVVQPTGPIITLDSDPLAGHAMNPVARRGEAYFDTASSSVSAQSVGALRHLARFLRGHPDTLVWLIGNCDERGSFAYNQRLGADRAIAVAKVLEENGVPAERIATRSNGKFKPMLRCHAEQCWKMNRRVDVIYGW